MAFSKLVLLSVLVGVSFFSLAKSGPEIKFGQAYTWEHKMALQKGGFRDTAKAIPCPCIWNNPRKRGSKEYEGRTWVCVLRDSENQCHAVALKGSEFALPDH